KVANAHVDVALLRGAQAGVAEAVPRLFDVQVRARHAAVDVAAHRVRGIAGTVRLVALRSGRVPELRRPPAVHERDVGRVEVVLEALDPVARRVDLSRPRGRAGDRF